MSVPADLLRSAKAALGGYDLDAFVATPLDGGFQATVWSLSLPGAPPSYALRLTPKPVPLIRRIGRVVDRVGSVRCARTIAVAPAASGMTAHLAAWLPGAPGPRMPDLGHALAGLHHDLATAPERLRDRPLTFDLADTDDVWSRARQQWVRGKRDWPLINGPAGSWQPIHGDTHRGNYLRTPDGQVGFIDFDKMMHASPVFDLARIVDSDLFTVQHGVAHFDTSGACQLLRAYYTTCPIADATIAALEGFAVLINEATGVLGRSGASPHRFQRATAIGRWWLERTGSHDPLGIRAGIGRPRTATARAKTT